MWMWGAFAIVVVASLGIDLTTHRQGRAASRRSAIVWSAIWIAVSLAFAAVIWRVLGGDHAEDFVTAYLLEKSLSIDNLFVFLIVFSRSKMSAAQQHRVLFWGILGALVFRGIFIGAGAAVISRWHEVLYALGVFLIYTGFKTVRGHANEPEAESRILTVIRERLHVKSAFLLAVITIELTGILFAIDSVPAVFAVTSDPFIVYTSNVFAILGLRALYLVLADLLGRLRYMHYGLGAILIIAGAKMLVGDLVDIPHLVALLAIAVILAVTIAASLLANRRDLRNPSPAHHSGSCAAAGSTPLE